MATQYVFDGYKPRPLRGGIYAPIPTPFKPDSEDVDVESLIRHAKRLAAAGVGLVVSGSTGEAIAMSHEERALAIFQIRRALEADAALKDTPIIAGTGGGSLRETIQYSHEAAVAGADAVIIITPGYFSAAIGSDRAALKDFFTTAADKSAVPVMVYNFPGAASGIDLDSDLLEDIAAHPNIVGAKVSAVTREHVRRMMAADILSFAAADVRQCRQDRTTSE